MGYRVREKKPKLGMQQFLPQMMMAANSADLIRSQMFSSMIDPRRNIDEECGYPASINKEQFKRLYDREGVAKRVVKIWPEECWSMDPEVYETEESTETAFEQAWNELKDRLNIWAHLLKVDELSGIGRFGVLLLGVDDGLELDKPLQGVSGGLTPAPSKAKKAKVSKARKLLYLRAFDESVIEITARELDPKNARFGQPTMYEIRFVDMDTVGMMTKSVRATTVHWTRVLHVADNRETSEVYGQPRMEVVYNRIYDLQKVAGGSGEMFWKGGFPGYAFELSPDAEAAGAEIDEAAMKEQISDWMNGLQRWLSLRGVTAKSLTPQVSDPASHVEVIMSLLAFSLGIPKRVFMGSEQAQLASGQDVRTWNKRVKKRQDRYVTPMLIREFVQRLIDIGILPTPAEFTVEWPDLNTVTDDEKAGVAKTRTEALSSYVGGGVEALIPPLEYFTMILGMEQDQAEEIIRAAEEYASSLDEEKLHKAEMDMAAEIKQAEMQVEAEKRLGMSDEEQQGGFDAEVQAEVDRLMKEEGAVGNVWSDKAREAAAAARAKGGSTDERLRTAQRNKNWDEVQKEAFRSGNDKAYREAVRAKAKEVVAARTAAEKKKKGKGVEAPEADRDESPAREKKVKDILGLTRMKKK
jgi:hypothetical protein